MHKAIATRQRHGGFALVLLLAFVVSATLYFIVGHLTPAALANHRAKQTERALTQARDALLGYALQYRDQQLKTGTLDAMYGYLPMPDIGSSQYVAMQSCKIEGCAMSLKNGAFPDKELTLVGRLPWRTLGIEPLSDRYGECLWYIVSAGHKNLGMDTNLPMNWDTLGQLDVVIADGADSLRSIAASPHDRPVAIIFSPGPPLPGQDRTKSAVDDVSLCGGNYDPNNYLDPNVVAKLRNLDGTDATADATYFDGNKAPDTSGERLAIAGNGRVLADGSLLRANACPAGSNCNLVANDLGLAVTPDDLFDALRKNANFRTDINAMLERMVGCLRDQIAHAGEGGPAFSIPEGRVPAHTCYDDTQVPRGYFTHWQEMTFASTESPTPGCPGLLIFANQRGPTQQRADTAHKDDWANNYLEAGFTLSPIDLFDTLASGQAVNQDITRCIPDTASFIEVGSPALPADKQIVDYDPGSRTLTLGKDAVTTGRGYAANTLFGCAWQPEARTLGKGFRAYFKFRFWSATHSGVSKSVGNNGFVFTAVDSLSNDASVCGAAGTHLGYSGNNGYVAPIAWPKVGIEFDQSRNIGAISSSLTSGRNDPCGTSDCGGTAGFHSHSAVLYWGVGSIPYDDNAHDYPVTGSQVGLSRPDPQNPLDLGASAPGIAFINYRGNSDVDGDGYRDSALYHVRIEVSPDTTGIQLASARAATAANIDLASPGMSLDGLAISAGNRVLLLGQANPLENGVYVWRSATTPLTRATDADSAGELTDSWIEIVEGTHRGRWRQIATLADLTSDAQVWRPAAISLRTQTWIERDSTLSDSPPLIAAMQDTTRPMAQLYPYRRAAACGVDDTCPTDQVCRTDHFCYRPNTPKIGNTNWLFGPATGTCATGCATGHTCGTDGQCYRMPMQSVRLGFTNSQRTQAQRVTINDFFATWLP